MREEETPATGQCSVLVTGGMYDQESDWLPQIGTFPLLEVPTGSERNLGSGNLQAFLPIWLQKSTGKWTAYGGGGYWINPGSQNRNWWFSGIVIQRQVLPNFAPGLEIFHGTSQQEGQSGETGFNLGMVWDLSDVQHIMFRPVPLSEDRTNSRDTSRIN